MVFFHSIMPHYVKVTLRRVSHLSFLKRETVIFIKPSPFEI